MTSNKELRDLLEQVARGEIDTAAAHARLMDELRASPYEDLGFARVDHHRSARQGFPEVVLGLGKTPAQIAGIAAEIVRRGSTLLVTRASAEAFEASQKYLRWQDKAANQKFFAGEHGQFSKEAADLLLEAGIIKQLPDMSKLADTRFLK